MVGIGNNINMLLICNVVSHEMNKIYFYLNLKNFTKEYQENTIPILLANNKNRSCEQEKRRLYKSVA